MLGEMRNLLRGPYPELPDEPLPVPRPSHISGLALLRGVFLSTGLVRSASDPALIAAGAGFILLFVASTVVAYAAVYLLQTAVGGAAPLVAIYTYAQPVTYPDPYLGWRLVVYAIRFGAFLGLLRLSPVSGYHGAEHKVVNAIELHGSLGEALVRRMPRQHVRCGTNLLAGLAPLLLELMPDVNMPPALLMVLLILGFALRRQIGYLVQTVFTTKEPTTAQLRAGIESGRVLLERWRTTPYRPSSPAERLWWRGLPQVLIGLGLGLTVMRYTEPLLLWLLQRL